MTKNILLFADGTGNKGGYTPDSNVYKMYNAIEIHDKNVTQYTYYDNGVGTSTNKYWRAFTGGIGVGIKQNIIDLYAFLAMNYVADDKVYLFGFSRGAATIRALADFINTVGLVDGQNLNDDVLREYTSDAFDAYKNHKRDKQAAENFYQHKNSHGQIKIHFVGVWDTVSALGLPKQTDKMGLGLNILTCVFDVLDRIIDRWWPHRFYEYDLNENIQFAYQALAIDDERTAFWPHVWNENGRSEDSVEQVWFSGMHSNVGGGYERQGMANVTLHWMMLRAMKHGITFKPCALEDAYEDSNIHGRLYNSRDGLAVYYRYHPREIKKLCEDKLIGNIKVHSSTLERLRKKTANYAPFLLPDKFDVVESDLISKVKYCDIKDDSEWNKQCEIINNGINTRKKLYGRLVDISLLVMGYFGWVLCNDSTEGTNVFSSLFNVATGSTTLNSILIALIENHLPFIIVILFILLILRNSRKSAFIKMLHAAEKTRCIIVKKMKIENK